MDTQEPTLKMNLGKRNYLIQNFREKLRQDKIFSKVGPHIQSFLNDALNYHFHHKTIEYKSVKKNYTFPLVFNVPIIGDIKVEHSVSKDIFEKIV